MSYQQNNPTYTEEVQWKTKLSTLYQKCIVLSQAMPCNGNVEKGLIVWVVQWIMILVLFSPVTRPNTLESCYQMELKGFLTEVTAVPVLVNVVSLTPSIFGSLSLLAVSQCCLCRRSRSLFRK